jgi:hypothetical protein
MALEDTGDGEGEGKGEGEDQPPVKPFWRLFRSAAEEMHFLMQMRHPARGGQAPPR